MVWGLRVSWCLCLSLCVCECLSLRAGVPKFRRQPVYLGPALAGQAPVQGDFSLGSWRIQNQPEHGAARCHRVGRAWGSVDTVRSFLSLWGPGLGSSVRLDGGLRAAWTWPELACCWSPP